MATPAAVSQAGQGQAHPGSPRAVAPAALRAPGGSLPAVRLPGARRAADRPGRVAGHLDGDGRRPRGGARLPVQRRPSRRRVPRRPRLQPQQQLHLGPHAGGHLQRPGDRQGRLRRLKRRVRQSVLHGDFARHRDRRGGQPHVQPPGRPVQRAPLPRHLDVRPVQPGGPQPVLAQYRPPARRAGHEHQLPRGRPAAQHDLPHEGRPQRRDHLRPADLHDRQPAGEPDFPHLHGAAGTGRQQRPDSGHGLPGRARGPARQRPGPGDRPGGQRRMVLRPGGQQLRRLRPEPRAGRHGPHARGPGGQPRGGATRSGRSTWPATPCARRPSAPPTPN